MARHARQHPTTKIEWSWEGEKDARVLAARTNGTAKQARLAGEVVWTVAHQDGKHTAFINDTQGRKIGLCLYRWCPRKISECGFHAAARKNNFGM